ncbi:phosphoribosylglycinamide formyltransferase [Helicobacter sp. 16-1353]|uniref:phosphoribosylglycinamide formyltransferase n=1 Tax=Helicobacter sp. 16-1353 TaxID=2004996 RepID=UPI000DCCA0EF|nr:phosphoribosylglycinamide formyltransferase [Helicobacter sp. 16-1353]RAX53049.1 phosphoribosylglycinamide formyltransferase [Helicobacter sp. 16-1353]
MKIKNLAILFSGNGSNLENLYLHLHNKIFDGMKINIPLALSSRRDAYGIKRCEYLNLKCEILSSKDYKDKSVEEYDARLIEILQSYNIDLVVLAGFMRILSDRFCQTFCALNIHPSILPLFKGSNAIIESYQSDMKIAGVSVHFVSKELDSGILVEQDIIHKIEGESLESFEARIHSLEYKIYPKAILKVLSKCKI